MVYLGDILHGLLGGYFIWFTWEIFEMKNLSLFLVSMCVDFGFLISRVAPEHQTLISV